MLEELVQSFTATRAVVALASIYLLVQLVQYVNTERKIRALGGHAPKMRGWLPWDLDFIITTVYRGSKHESLEDWQGHFNHFGGGQYTVEVKPAGQRFIFTADVENIKAILATQFNDYGKGEPFHRDWHEFLGDSIFTTDHQQWHDSRHLIRPQFIKERVSDLEVLEKHVHVLLDAIANGGVKGAPGVATDGVGRGREVNVADLFFRYTLDSATDFLLGHSVNSLEVEEQEFAISFGEVQRLQNLISKIGPLNSLMPRGPFRKHLKVVNDFVNPFVERVMRLTPEDLETKTKSESGYTFLHALAGYTRDRKVLRDQLVAVLLAGRDTTACTLSWTFYELGRHPEVVERLRQEIIDTVGLDRPPTYNDLKNMKYLQHVMSETLRLYPVVPYNIRLALHDTTLPHGGGPDGLAPIGILKDTPIAYSPLVMQRRPDIYPASWRAGADPALDPLNFNPSRWYTWQPKPWTYIPFNGGPRICIGQQFALTEMAYTIVRLLQRFERLELRAGQEPVLKSEIVLQPGMGVWMSFWETGVRERMVEKGKRGLLDV